MATAAPGPDEGLLRRFRIRRVRNDDLRTDQFGIYVKKKPRGPGYVTDIVYVSRDLPVTVYAVLIDRGHGLEVAELELFRDDWGCGDGFGNYIHADDQPETVIHEDDDEDHGPRPLITSDLLPRIPSTLSSPAPKLASRTCRGARTASRQSWAPTNRSTRSPRASNAP